MAKAAAGGNRRKIPPRRLLASGRGRPRPGILAPRGPPTPPRFLRSVARLASLPPLPSARSLLLPRSLRSLCGQMQSYCNLINAKDREREKERRGGHFSSYRRGGGNSGADLEGLGQVCVRRRTDGRGRTAYPIPGAVHFTAAAAVRGNQIHEKNCEHGGTTSRTFIPASCSRPPNEGFFSFSAGQQREKYPLNTLVTLFIPRMRVGWTQK